MEYKVGDKVKIKNIHWWNENKRICDYGFYSVDGVSHQSFVEGMEHYCGMDAIITQIMEDTYRINLDDRYWDWCDWMFEQPNIISSPVSE